MKIKIALLLILGFYFNSFAQSSEALAKYHFIKAQNAYGNGDNATAITNLNTCVSSLGKTNSKIEALYTYVYYNKKNYTKTKEHMTTYFKIASEDHSDYMKMISLLTVTNNKAKEEKEKQIEEQQDHKNWELAMATMTSEAFETYLLNSKNKIYRGEAEKYNSHKTVTKLLLLPDGYHNKVMSYLCVKDFASLKYYFNVTRLAATFTTKAIFHIPKDIDKLTKITEIDFSNDQLVSLPESIGNLKNLKSLTLEDNKLISLPESIGKLKNLETLYLHKNQLTSLPESIGNLTRLIDLRLDDNQLTSLVESIGNLNNLNRLIIGKNQLTSLPESFGKLQNLNSLYLYQNQLTSLPKSFEKLQSLNEIALGRNQLTNLPINIGSLKNLTKLWLDINQLTSLPESIGNLQNLKILCLHKNKLTSLPLEICKLTSLTRLDLDYNQLTSLPASLGNLNNLSTHLDLSHNENLTDLPMSMVRLTNPINIQTSKDQKKLNKALSNLKKTNSNITLQILE
ncbi:leucine-rich repeat domain-containing protein [Flavobacterium ovatum]|uniref:leucine-rich repeat domain-containing protein n=1 Tax=Flavobacterium ovatum TaxID=1928857 RepID=UPI00344CCF14